MDAVIKKCNHCDKCFRLGFDGVYDSKTRSYSCDACLGIERDLNGEAWLPDESFQLRQNVETEQEFILTRESAFGRLHDNK